MFIFIIIYELRNYLYLTNKSLQFVVFSGLNRSQVKQQNKIKYYIVNSSYYIFMFELSNIKLTRPGIIYIYIL